AEAGAGDEGPGGVAAAGAGERAGAGGLAVGDGLEVGDAVAVVLGEEDGGAVVGEGGGEALGGVDVGAVDEGDQVGVPVAGGDALVSVVEKDVRGNGGRRSEEHTSELQSREKLVCRLLLEKKKKETRS